MNERIRELLKQSRRQASEIQTPGSGAYENLVFEKFAELLILECTQQCVSIGEIAEQINLGEMARKTKATAQGCAQMIKWRFGLE